MFLVIVLLCVAASTIVLRNPKSKSDFLMFSLSYIEMLNDRHPRQILLYNILFVFPVTLMYIFFPLNFPYFNLKNDLYVFFIAVWVIPYIIASNALLFYLLFSEKDKTLRHEKIINSIFIIPSTIFILFSCYVFVLYVIYGNCYQYPPAVILEFVAFNVLGIKYDVPNVKPNLEKSHQEGAKYPMTTGMAILNHTIKSEMFKINISSQNVRISLDLSKQDKPDGLVDESLKIISNSTNHVLEMMDRISGHLQDIVLEKMPCNLLHIIENSLESSLAFFKQKNIHITRQFECSPELVCDEVHLKEVFNNIFKNAAEALKTEGMIIIKVSQNKNQLVVEVKDNGNGISKEDLPFIFDPFFSTKSRKTNFGLGLSYCYNVLQKHGGSLKIKSKENMGTSVLLKLPRYYKT